jgi:hypothetical protein
MCGAVAISCAHFWMLSTLLEQQQKERDALDFSVLTPEEAYQKGRAHGFQECAMFHNLPRV